MKITILQENLAAGLATVSGAVSKRGYIPAVGHVLIEADGGRLKLTATNLEITVATWAGAQVEEEGGFSVPAAPLREFVRLLPAGVVSIALAGKQMHLQCGAAELTLATGLAEDYPSVPQVDGEETEIDGKAFAAAIRQVEWAASKDDARPVLMGIYLSEREGECCLAAANGFTLSVYALPEGALVEKTGLIIPATALRELIKHLSDGPVRFGLNERRTSARFEGANWAFTSTLIQGSFPNFRQLIPGSYSTRAVFATDALRREVMRARIAARDAAGIVRLSLAEGRIAVAARAMEIGEVRGEIDAEIEGDGGKIAFNASYLLDALGAMNADRASLEITTPGNPGVLRPEGGAATHVVMPVFVQW